MQNMAYFYTGQIFSIAKEAYNKSISQTQQNKPSDDALVAIVFAVSTLEALMSQVIDMAKDFAKMSPKIDMFVSGLKQTNENLFLCLHNRQSSQLTLWLIHTIFL